MMRARFGAFGLAMVTAASLAVTVALVPAQATTAPVSYTHLTLPTILLV